VTGDKFDDSVAYDKNDLSRILEKSYAMDLNESSHLFNRLKAERYVYNELNSCSLYIGSPYYVHGSLSFSMNKKPRLLR
jgi:hypothetical protein